MRPITNWGLELLWVLHIFSEAPVPWSQQQRTPPTLTWTPPLTKTLNILPSPLCEPPRGGQVSPFVQLITEVMDTQQPCTGYRYHMLQQQIVHQFQNDDVDAKDSWAWKKNTLKPLIYANPVLHLNYKADLPIESRSSYLLSLLLMAVRLHFRWSLPPSPCIPSPPHLIFSQWPRPILILIAVNLHFRQSTSIYIFSTLSLTPDFLYESILFPTKMLVHWSCLNPI